MATPDKIHYFNIRARAEPTRMIYALAGEPLTDQRISGREEWVKIKADQPLGQVPVFTCSEGTMVMSNAIARYTAKKFGMMGGSLWEEALNDMIVEVCSETFGTYGAKVLRWKIFKVEKEPENPEKVMEEVYQGFLKSLAYIQKVAEKRGANFLTSDKISLGDIWLFCSLQHAAVVYPDVMKANPWVEEFVSKMTADERMSKYLSERPVTPV